MALESADVSCDEGMHMRRIADRRGPVPHSLLGFQHLKYSRGLIWGSPPEWEVLCVMREESDTQGQGLEALCPLPRRH